MSNYQLKIKLLSDLCVSDGGVYNSSLDTDICYDQYGFPYIPAKRIKGCLRECALELRDWGMNVPIKELFGDEGADNKRAKIRIGNAVLENYGDMLKQTKEFSGNLIFHSQNVLNHFSYVRTQTSIDYETGVADPTSLRTMRVVKKDVGDKPTVFVAEVEIDDQLDADDIKAFTACCETLTNMGIGRTRGLGEVQVELIPSETGRPSVEDVSHHVDYVSGAVKLYYELDLEEPMICKSTNGGESRSLDYIEGNKILGLIINEMKNQGKDFLDFMNSGRFFCSNAYLMHNGERCIEVPANYYSIKNDHDNYLEKMDADRTPEHLKDKQLNAMKHCYVRKDANGNLVQADVDMEERYHHSRPQDKSFGRADPREEGSKFYQMSSIEANQKFAGFITGAIEQIKDVYDCLSNLNIVYLGYSHSAEYGKTKITITDLQAEQPVEKITSKTFTVKLEAPVLIYNDRAFYSTQITDLDKEVRTILGLSNDVVEGFEKYVNYTTVGGYNVTWDERKPMVEAFDKGTVLIYHLKEPVEIVVPELFLIGERLNEGFGEASVSFIKGDEQKLYEGKECQYAKVEKKTDCIPVVSLVPGSFAEDLCRDLFLDFVRASASEDAKNYAKEKNWDKDDAKMEAARPTVSNMLLMCQNSNSFNSISDTVEKRYGEDPTKKKNRRSDNKNGKLEIARGILKKVKQNCGSLTNRFCEKYSVSDYTGNANYYKYQYLKAFLQRLKYIFRATDGPRIKKEGA